MDLWGWHLTVKLGGEKINEHWVSALFSLVEACEFSILECNNLLAGTQRYSISIQVIFHQRRGHPF